MNSFQVSSWPIPCFTIFKSLLSHKISQTLPLFTASGIEDNADKIDLDADETDGVVNVTTLRDIPGCVQITWTNSNLVVVVNWKLEWRYCILPVSVVGAASFLIKEYKDYELKL